MFLSKGINRELWRLAFPMILSNLSTPLLGMVDTAVVGHLAHPYYLGAVALGGTIFGFLYWGFGFLRMGTTGLTAQAVGSDANLEITATLCRALLLALVLAFILLALREPIATLAFSLLEGSPQSENYARQYFLIRILSAPATLGIYACIGWFIGLQNTRIPLMLTLLINLTNIVLDFLFVWKLKWNVAGVAAASVIADYTGLLAALVFVYARWHRLAQPGWRIVSDWRRLRLMFQINIHLFIRTLLLIFSFAFFTAQSARLGDVILAANTILLNFQGLMAYTLDGFAHAAEALTGRAMGKHDFRLLHRIIVSAGRWCLTFASLFSLVYAVAGEQIIRLLTSLDPVQTMAIHYLPWAVLLPLISSWSFLLDGVFIGLTRAREMRNVMIISVLACYLPLWWWLRSFENLGLWIAFTAFMTVRTLMMDYYRHRILIHPA